MQPKWLTTGRVLWFILGNISKDNVVKTVKESMDTLNLQVVERDSLCDIRHLDILQNNL